MAIKAQTRRKKVNAPSVSGKLRAFVARNIVTVKITDIRPHPKNPRIGQIRDIAQSLKNLGQFKPLFVQRSTGYIIMGNHTYKAARDILKWKKIDVLYLDVDKAKALEILLADNRYSDLATYDTEILADILKGIPDPGNTGYDEEAVRAITASIDDRDEEMMQEAIHPARIEFTGEPQDVPFDDQVEDLQKRSAAKAELLQGEEDEEDIKVEQAALSIAGIQTQLEQLEEYFFEGHNEWGVPDLLPDMLVDTLPEKLDTWGGHEVTPDDGATTWIWNFGLASTKNLPWQRAIMSMFTFDTKFEQWWDKPAFNCARVIHNGLTQAIVPDFSMWADDPPYYHLKAAFQAQWLGRFMQEAGIKIIPRLMWCSPESIKIGMLGVPTAAPIVAVCIQAIDKKEMKTLMSADGLRLIIKQLKPECLLVYSGNPGKDMVASAKLPKELEIRYVDNYAAKRRGIAYDNPTGKLAVEKAQKKMARRKKMKDKAKKESAA